MVVVDSRYYRYTASRFGVDEGLIVRRGDEREEERKAYEKQMRVLFHS
jgi:hypothetical protein